MKKKKQSGQYKMFEKPSFDHCIFETYFAYGSRYGTEIYILLDILLPEFSFTSIHLCVTIFNMQILKFRVLRISRDIIEWKPNF